VLSHHRATRLTSSGSDVEIQTPRIRIRAEQAVLAVGAYLPRIVPALQKVVRPVRAQMLATHAAPEQRISTPVYSHQGYYYVRQLDDGTILAGGGRQKHRDTEIGYEDTTTPAVQADIERYLHSHFPWTTSLRVQSRWSGTMGFSPDERPVVGRVPNVPAAVFATGFTGHGMGFGMRMGQLLAETLRSEQRPKAFDLFAASRFEESAAA
jgi:glycine/D-amino acid oxidase-like deaminating enzyme